MRIAFDVKGTIEGPRKAIVLKFLSILQAQGHDVIVWSNSYGYAVDAVRDNKLIVCLNLRQISGKLTAT